MTEPILLAGAPRSFAILNGTLAASIGLGLRLWLAGLLIWFAGHAIAVWVTRKDPAFLTVLSRHTRHKGALVMLNLAEYRKKTTTLRDYLPWACLVGPGIVLNKDGSFQRTLRYRGPDLDSATEAELVSVTARLNNVLKRFGAGWALFFEAERVPANQYPGARFADPASWLVDQERYAAFSADGAHHESRYYVTLLYLPPPEREGQAERFLYERTD